VAGGHRAEVARTAGWHLSTHEHGGGLIGFSNGRVAVDNYQAMKSLGTRSVKKVQDSYPGMSPIRAPKEIAYVWPAEAVGWCKTD